MALLEALSSNELFNFVIYDTISANPCSQYQQQSSSLENGGGGGGGGGTLVKPSPNQGTGSNSPSGSSSAMQPCRRSKGPEAAAVAANRKANMGVQEGSRKKRRRRPRICKNKEEAETQRMTHIAVERNRRRLMNQHLSVLRSLMPDSYVQRGDQASIVGGAIEFVKELEHLVQSLEAQKIHQQQGASTKGLNEEEEGESVSSPKLSPPPFSQFFGYPQYTWSQLPNKFTSKSKEAIADIEVTLIETHASIRILSRRSPRKLSRMVVGFHMLRLTILHLNVTTLDQLALYSISAKVEEGCQLTSVDDIAGAVHHMLRIIEDEGTPY